MKSYVKSMLTGVTICVASSLLLTSCYTVKGAFQGAGKDVSVLVGQDNGHPKKTTVNKPQTTTAKSTSQTTTSQNAKTMPVTTPVKESSSVSSTTIATTPVPAPTLPVTNE